MQLMLVSEELGIEEIVEIEKWYSDDLMLKRKTPRRFEFVSIWDKDDFKVKVKRTYPGYLKGGKTYSYAYLAWKD